MVFPGREILQETKIPQLSRVFGTLPTQNGQNRLPSAPNWRERKDRSSHHSLFGQRKKLHPGKHTGKYPICLEATAGFRGFKMVSSWWYKFPSNLFSRHPESIVFLNKEFPRGAWRPGKVFELLLLDSVFGIKFTEFTDFSISAEIWTTATWLHGSRVKKNTSRHRDFQIWILLSSPWRCTLQETITWTRKIHRLKHALVREALRIQDYPEISWGWGWNPEKKHSSKGFGFLAKCSKLKAFSRALVAYCIQHVHQKFPSPILFPRNRGTSPILGRIIPGLVSGQQTPGISHEKAMTY